MVKKLRIISILYTSNWKASDFDNHIELILNSAPKEFILSFIPDYFNLIKETNPVWWTFLLLCSCACSGEGGNPQALYQQCLTLKFVRVTVPYGDFISSLVSLQQSLWANSFASKPSLTWNSWRTSVLIFLALSLEHFWAENMPGWSVLLQNPLFRIWMEEV